MGLLKLQYLNALPWQCDRFRPKLRGDNGVSLRERSHRFDPPGWLTSKIWTLSTRQYETIRWYSFAALTTTKFITFTTKVVGDGPLSGMAFSIVVFLTSLVRTIGGGTIPSRPAVGEISLLQQHSRLSVPPPHGISHDLECKLRQIAVLLGKSRSNW
jgi:hypothetical protein